MVNNGPYSQAFVKPTFLLIIKIKIQGVPNWAEKTSDSTSGDVIQGTYGYTINLKEINQRLKSN